MIRSMLACVTTGLLWLPAIPAGEPTKGNLLLKPDAFQTLVNPDCSHCRDEAKRRGGELKADDPVLCWIRGYSDGGVIPYRFFLNPYRVISDTYGVFVYDADAGFSRGFAPSLDFQFAGWRNGVMVMKHKDGTLYSCLTGIAFDGPRKGDKLHAVPTLVSNWGYWLERYPQAVAYHMFDKYKSVELPKEANPDSIKTRLPPDKRMPADALVLGVVIGKTARAYPIDKLAKEGMIKDEVDGEDVVVFWHGPTKSAAAYRPVASAPKPDNFSFTVHFTRDDKDAAAPVVDKSGSRWDIAGRAVAGELKGYTLEWLDGVQVKWFAWAAEHPQTTIYTKSAKKGKDAIREVAGSAEYLSNVPKRFATLVEADSTSRKVTLRQEGEKDAKRWNLTSDAEIKIHGWWGRLEQLRPGDRVWAWFTTDRSKKPKAIFMLADEPSEQEIHGGPLAVTDSADGKLTVKSAYGKPRTVIVEAALTKDLTKKSLIFMQSESGQARMIYSPKEFELIRQTQRTWLRQRWLDQGLPGTLGFVHVYSGEADLILDHETMRWARSLKNGAKVKLQTKPPINAVVKSFIAQREKTQVRLVAHSLDLADLQPGQRVRLMMGAPPDEVEAAVYPPDIDAPRGKPERIEWFLANIYCTCGVGGDICTGHFYTLASCNPNGCALPNATRQELAKLIDNGLTDRQIFDRFLKDRGQAMLRPHLRP